MHPLKIFRGCGSTPSTPGSQGPGLTSPPPLPPRGKALIQGDWTTPFCIDKAHKHSWIQQRVEGEIHGHQWGWGGGGWGTGVHVPPQIFKGDIILNVSPPPPPPTFWGLYDYSLKRGSFFHMSSPALCTFFFFLLVREVGDVYPYSVSGKLTQN